MQYKTFPGPKITYVSCVAAEGVTVDMHESALDQREGLNVLKGDNMKGQQIMQLDVETFIYVAPVVVNSSFQSFFNDVCALFKNALTLIFHTGMCWNSTALCKLLVIKRINFVDHKVDMGK